MRAALPGGPASLRGARAQTDAAPCAPIPAAIRGHRLPCAVLLAVLVGLQALCLMSARPAWLPEKILITLAPGASLALGQHVLAAPQADQSHLGLRRDASGAWWVHNLSVNRQLLLQRGAKAERMGHATLRPGQAFQVGSDRFQVSSAPGAALTLARGAQRWSYDGASLYRDGQPLPPCADATLAARVVAGWNRALPTLLSIGRPLAFGGNLYCGNRLGLDGVTPGAALLSRIDGQLQLAAGTPDGPAAALLLTSDGVTIDLRGQEQRLSGVSALVAGRTRLRVEIKGDQLSLSPGGRVTLYDAPETVLPAAVQWQWRQRQAWLGDAPSGGPMVALLATSLVLTLALLAVSRAGNRPESGAGASLSQPGNRWRHAAPLAAAALVVAGLTALLAQRSGHPPGAACSLLLGAAALACWLMAPPRLTLATGAALVLLAIGQLAQLEMGLGGMESSWLRYYQKSAALLAIGAGLTGLWLARRRAAPQHGAPVSQRAIEARLALLAAAALLALAAEVFWGDETGVFDLQPVELAKLALTALSAHCLALRLSWGTPGAPWPHGWRAMTARWLRLIAPALLFLALLAGALVQVDDYSPLILLLVWCAGMALAHAVAVRHGWLAAALAGAAVLGVLGIVYLRSVGTAGPAPVESSAGAQWNFYADRFAVWRDPARHPHTGQQLLLGARAIGAGGWWGPDHLLGLATLGQRVGGALQIPAVQDDFAPALLLHRHGLAGGLLLWAVQVAFLTGLLQAAGRAYAAAAAARHFQQAWRWRFRYFALCGGAAFVLGHLLLSWGTNLALFPIMGQPMSFLSAGGSHLLIFLCPLLALVTECSFEEKPSCRSMSSTKS